MSSYGVISADSHFVEPPKMWGERLDKKFRDRAPHTVRGLNGKDGEFFVCQNINPFPVAAFFGAGVPSEQLPEHNKKGMEAAPASVWDPAARLKDQDRDGIVAEVIYTSMGMPLYMLDDAELRTACFRAYNDWAVEYCSHNPKRLLPLGLLTLEDIGAAVQELERIAKKGIRGAMIWAEAPLISRTIFRTMTLSGRRHRSTTSRSRCTSSPAARAPESTSSAATWHCRAPRCITRWNARWQCLSWVECWNGSPS